MSAWAEAVYLLNKITEKFTALTTLVNSVKTEATSAKTNASNAATDAASIKTTVGTINTNVNTVKTDVATIKTDAAAAKTSAASAATDAATAKTNASNANTNASTAATRAQSIIDTLGSRGTGSTVYSILGTVNTNASNAASRAQSILTAINNGGMNASAVKSIQKGYHAYRDSGWVSDTEANALTPETITVSSVNTSKSVLLIDGLRTYWEGRSEGSGSSYTTTTYANERAPQLTSATVISVHPVKQTDYTYNGSYDNYAYRLHYPGFNWTLVEFY